MVPVPVRVFACKLQQKGLANFIIIVKNTNKSRIWLPSGFEIKSFGSGPRSSKILWSTTLRKTSRKVRKINGRNVKTLGGPLFSWHCSFNKAFDAVDDKMLSREWEPKGFQKPGAGAKRRRTCFATLIFAGNKKGRNRQKKTVLKYFNFPLCWSSSARILPVYF